MAIEPGIASWSDETPLNQRQHDGDAWRDRLVELHVLAEHGDDDAARTAQRWLSSDAAARHVWDKRATGVRSSRRSMGTPRRDR